MMKKSFLAIMALAFTSFIFTSCNKNQSTYHNEFSEDQAFAESVFSDLSKIADEGFEKGSSQLKKGDDFGVILSDCAEITIDLSEEPYTLVIDFGEENCLCNDNRNRRGKVIVSFDGFYREAGTTIIHTLENYFVDDHQVEGTRTVVNKGRNENDHFQYDVEESGEITKESEEKITWESTRSREWIEGSDTFQVTDDVYLLTGTSTGSSNRRIDGSTTYTYQAWTMEIVDPLRVELNCQWIPSGSINIKFDELPLALLDYGTGDCDRKATLEVEGKVYTFYMK